MSEEKFEELEQLIMHIGREILISNNKILLNLNMLQNDKIADKEEIKKAAEKNANKIISQIINKMQAGTGMTVEEYEKENGSTVEENERARIEAESDTKLKDVNDEDLYGDDE